MSTKLTIGTTGVSGLKSEKGSWLWRVGFREALAAGTHTAWFKPVGSSVAQNCPIFAPESEQNPTTSVTVRAVLYGPFINGDTVGISSTGDQTNKEVYYDVIPL